MKTSILMMFVLVSGSVMAQAPDAELMFKKQQPQQAFYPPVPPTAAELAERDARDIKKDGALVLASIDWSVPTSKDPFSPNWYIYRKHIVNLRLRGGEMVVRTAAKSSEAEVKQMLANVGIASTGASEFGVFNDWIVTLASKAADESAMHRTVRTALTGGFVFASPCFDDVFGRKRRVYPTPNVMANFAGNCRASAAALAPEFDLINSDWALMPGAAFLRSRSNDGFTVMTQCNALASQPGVRWAEPDFMQEIDLHTLPNDTFFGNQLHLRNTGTPVADYTVWRAWNFATGSGVRVLVMDSGCQLNHPDLPVAGGRNFVGAPAAGNGDGSPVGTCDDHGTSVLGTIAATFNNNLGVAGVAPNCQGYSARTWLQQSMPSCSSAGAGGTYSDVANALAWGRNQGCRVSNSSFGGGTASATMEQAYADAYTVTGMVHFVSSGNDGVATIQYPSNISYVNAVGGINSGATRVYNYGTGLDFTGLAQGVATTDRTGSVGYASGDYANVNGTSFSSPGVAGVAALLFSAKPWLSNASLEARLATTAKNLGPAGYDTDFGWGVPDAHLAITYFGPSNDVCAGAKTINAANYTDTFTNLLVANDGREENQENCEVNAVGVSNSVWYKYTSGNAFVTLVCDTFGSNYDTVLSAWNGCASYSAANDGVTGATQLACSDDANGTTQSRVTVNLLPNQTVYLKVANYGAPMGWGSPSLTFHATATETPPPNNACNAATQLPFVNTFPYAFANYPTTGAASPTNCSGDSPSCADSGKAVWWKITPTNDGYFAANTFGSTYDTVLSVYSRCGFNVPLGIGGGGYTCIAPFYLACNDDSGGLQSAVSGVPMYAGSTYYIRVAGYRNGAGVVASGSMALSYTFTPASLAAPANDMCENAEVLPGDQPVIALEGFSTINATTGQPGNSCGDPNGNPNSSQSSGHSVWYAWTPVADGTADIDTIGSNHDTLLTVYNGAESCPFNDGTCHYPAVMTYNDDSGGNLTSLISGYTVQGGQRYLIRVATFGTNPGGNTNLHINYTATPPQPPANDACTNATLLDPLLVANELVTSPVCDPRAATAGDPCADRPLACDTPGTPPGKTVWYELNVPGNGLLSIDSIGTQYDTVLTVFDVTGAENPCEAIDPETQECVGPVTIICNDNIDEFTLQSATGQFAVTSGQRLFVRLALATGDTIGDAFVNVLFAPDLPPACPADLGMQGGEPGQDGLLDNNDFVVFINFFFAADPGADVGMQGGEQGADGLFDNNDFVVFINLFFAGCP